MTSKITIVSIFLIIVLITAPVYAQAFCDRVELVDPEFPAGLTGNYSIIGVDSNKNVQYSGSLSIGAEKTYYTLERKIGQETITGQAWIVKCGADKVTQLEISYDTKPEKTQGFCDFGMDSDNYFRITCKTRKEKTMPELMSLEAWFQDN